MARKVLIAMIATLMLYGCSSTVHVRVDHRVPPPPSRVVRHSYVNVIKDSPRFDKVTVVINNRVKFNLKEVNRRRPLENKTVKVSPGVNHIIVYHRGRVIYDRRINVAPGRTFQVRV